MDLNDDEREWYEERLAICMAQPDVSDERAREVARAMVERMRVHRNERQTADRDG